MLEFIAVVSSCGFCLPETLAVLAQNYVDSVLRLSAKYHGLVSAFNKTLDLEAPNMQNRIRAVGKASIKLRDVVEEPVCKSIAQNKGRAVGRASMQARDLVDDPSCKETMQNKVRASVGRASTQVRDQVRDLVGRSIM